MTYTPNTWTNGDVITAGKLNAMESGISGADTAAGNAATAAEAAATAAANAAHAAFIVTLTEGTGDDSPQYTADKTFAEIAAAVAAGKIVILNNEAFIPLTYCGEAEAECSTVNVNSDILYYQDYIITASGVEYEEFGYTLTPVE